eukprot:TRINITY_DN33415_c0_g1_i1.p2 TRINITY_DN33415_c0_g1~~TRINITY_DN33415_c0_g1_i1.p2  ORF type:complete len:158 (-),score=16.60 TRINITY_DN33415_c0_g1_i1:568-1041(-)
MEQLAQEKILVRRFAPVAGVACCTSDTQCSHHGWECPNGFRNEEEYTDAAEVARRLHAGWTWAWSRRVMQPPRFDRGEASLGQFCCLVADGTSRLGAASAECFENPFYSFHRCCTSGELLGVARSPGIESMALAECWKLGDWLYRPNRSVVSCMRQL